MSSPIPVDYLKHLALPAIALALTWIGYLARLTRTSMFEVLNQNYIRTAQAFGLQDRRIYYKYALKNAIIPTVAVLGVGLGTLMGGAVFVEIIFTRAGLGTLILDSIENRNFPIVRGAVLVIAVLFVVRQPARRPLLPPPRSPRPGGARSSLTHGGRSSHPAPASAPFGRMAGPVGLLKEVAGRPAGLFGLVVVGGLVVLAIFAPLIAPYDPAAQDIANRLQGPSWDHLLGTDQLGRDLLSRLIYGVRVALSVALPGLAAALVIGL